MKVACKRSTLPALAAALIMTACDSEPPPIAPTGADGIVNNRLLTGAEFDTVILSNRPVAFVTISARWCGSCRASAPAIEAAAENYEGRVVFARLDYDQETELVKRYEVNGVPTLLVFKDGVPVDKYEGPPAVADIHKILRPHLPPQP